MILRVVLFFLSGAVMMMAAPSVPIETAVEKQVAAEAAPTVEERQQLLNDALAIYLSYVGDSPSARLLNNIGEIYVSFGRYGMAIWYYHQALAFAPRDPIIRNNLQAAATQANVAFMQQEEWWSDLWGLRWFSPLERTLLAIGAIGLTFVLFSLNVWLPGYGFRGCWRVFAIGTSVVVLALLTYGLFVPGKAVVLQAMPLYASSDGNVQKLSGITVRPGEVVQVFNVDASRQMVYVKTASQSMGYVPATNLGFVP